MEVADHGDVDIESSSTVTDKRGVKRQIRSYRCNTCGQAWSDTVTAPPCRRAKSSAGGDTTGEGEEAMAKSNGDDKSKRLQNALEEGWEYGHIYKRKVVRRKDKKEFLCTMKPTKAGFVDQDGKSWDAPTALTTHFMNKKVGVSGRRPAKFFFAADAKTPKSKKIDTRPGEKKAPKVKPPKKAAAPKKAAPKAGPSKATTQAAAPEPPELKI